MGGKTATTTQSVKIPEEVMARYNAVNARAEQAATQPFQAYTGQFVAPINQTQQAGINAVGAAANMAQPYYQAATQQLMNAQGAATPMYYGALGTGQQAANVAGGMYGEALQGGFTARDIGSQYATRALGDIGSAYGTASPYMSQAGALTQAGLGAAAPMMGQAANYLQGGTQAVNAGDLGAAQINQYMSPYMRNVVEAQQKLQLQENAAQQAALRGTQIGSGAFGGDRAGISSANLAKQQSMANQATLANLLQSGYGQAVGTAQQQQAQRLAAEQANRAAMQFGTQAAANLAQQGFGQNLAASQQLGNLGQALYGQRMGQGQALAGLGQQQYGQQLGAAQLQAGLGQNIYGMGAQQAALQQGIGQGLYGMGAQTAQSLAGLGAGAQQAALQGAQAQIGAGTLEQQTQQAQNTAQYQQFLQERGYPFQVAQFLANIAMGTGALSGSTTTSTQQAPFFSDVRLKDDVEPVGELYDGQKVYRYSMGDGPKQLGLLAQEVEHVRPDAVGESSGFKTVDYDRATSDAAGLGAAASMGGAVTEPGNYADGGLVPRRGYALSGSVVDGTDLNAILASQAQSFGPFGQSGLYGGSAMGAPFSDAKGSVPAAKLPSPKLVTAGSAPSSSSRSGLSQAVNDIKGTINTGKSLANLAVGSAGTKDNPKGEAGLFGAGGKFSSEDNMAQRAKDWLSSTFAYGGVVPREGYALKGMVDPYETVKDPTKGVGSYIEDASESQDDPNNMLKPGQMPGAPKSGMSQIGEAAGTALALGKLGSLAMSFLPVSDARLKDNIRPVGETYDGQGIYAYDMGDGRTKIGLMAQEVMKRHPEAVGERNGYLTLDYDKATGEATPYAYGGLVPRQGYATEGAVEEEKEKPAFDIEKAKGAIAGIESGGRYEALGPVTGRGDRAYGKYQVMGANIPSWTEEALGKRMTPDEFVKNPEAQEKVFEHHFGKSVQKYGNPYDAASVWFSGRPMARAGNASDVLGTTVPGYVSKFRSAYEGEGAPRPPGLVPGEERRAAGVEYVKGKEEPSMFGNLVEKASSRDFFVPALSFVGSMLSSKSPYLAGAIGEGIVGGVSAYQSEKKAQLDTAKGIMDLIKDRFTPTYDSATKTTKFFDKNTGSFAQPGQVQGVAYDMMVQAGLNPKQWGVNVPDARGPIPGAIGAIPAIGAQKPGEAPAKPGEVAAKPGETAPQQPGQAKTEEKAPVLERTEMGVEQLKDDVRKNPEKYGLEKDRRPDNWQAKIDGMRQDAEQLGNMGRSTEAAQRLATANLEQQRLDKAIEDAVSLQAKENEDLIKARSESVKGYRQNIGKRLEIYDKERAELMRLADIYGAFQTGRLEEYKAKIESMAKGVGMEKFIPKILEGDAAAFDAAMKTALKRAFEAVDANNMARAPKAALQEGILTVPGPTLDPGAVYEMIGRSLGEMDYEHAKDKSYLDRPFGTDPVKFLSEQSDKKGELLQKKYQEAFGSLPVPKGAKPEFVRGLEKSFNFRAKGSEASPAERQAAPAPSVSSGTYVGEERQFRGGLTGVWDGSKWVPKQ